MHRSFARRILAGVVAAAASTVLAAPAFAAAPQFAVVLPDVIVAAGGVTYLDPILVADQDVTVTGAKMTYELSGGLDGVSLATPGVFADCANDGPAKLVCTSPSQAAGFTTNMIAEVDAEKAAAGTAGEITLTFTADGVAPATYTADVTVAEAVDLVAGDAGEISLAPGRTFDAAVQVRNNSATAVHGAALFVHSDNAFAATREFSNCFYVEDRLTYCVFDTDLAAGASYQVDLPLALRADPYAPSDVLAGFEWLTGDEFANLSKFITESGLGNSRRDAPIQGEPGSGGALTLDELPSAKSLAQADIDPGNNWQPLDVHVTGKNGVDLEAIGATARGDAGDVFDIQVGARNNGPATLDRTRNGGAAAVVIVTIPGGTQVVQAPAGCRVADDDSLRTGNGGLQYACFTDPIFPTKTTVTWKFRLKFTNFWPDASGFVEVNPPCNCDRFADDTDKSNNVAPILMNPAGGEGGGLPITGPQTTTIGAAGAALVAAGLLGFLVARRRRTRFEA